MFKSYYIKSFPINLLANYAEEQWVHNPNSLRNKYKYLEAIIEDIDNSFCEPILVTKSGNDYIPGPHGVNRLMALIKIKNVNEFPAILNTPDPISIFSEVQQITTLQELQKYYKRELSDPNVASVIFGANGIEINSWNSFSVQEIAKTFKASQETKNRIIELFAIEHIDNNTLKSYNISQEQLDKWHKAYNEFKCGRK